jgi:hypothetical protein
VLYLREYISEGRTYIRFEEYQLSRGQIGLSPTILNSSDNTATLTRSTYLLVWSRIDHHVSGLIIVTLPALDITSQSLSLGLLTLLLL